MPKATTPNLFVVDGSNIATEGRSQPSLEQLNEAVLAFLDERADTTVTVVVDATFGHRIAKKESKAFDEAVANNELVTPPAGAIGRGDAFVLSIANKAGAGVLSNDSFQEFHGDYDWLFEEGRLVGGKPVPHVGWVFVDRTPVRGPKSRRAVKEAKDGDRTDAKQQANRRVRAKRPVAEEDTPAAEPAVESGRKRGRRSERAAKQTTDDVAAAPSSSKDSSKDHVNELMPFLEFVERHPVGTSCTAQVESYASHGAYARTGDVLIYIPLRLMDDPTPRSARSVLKVGEAVALVVVGFTPERRSIDAAMPHMAAGSVAAATASEPEQPAPARKSPAKKAAARKSPAKKATARKSPAKKATAKKAPAKKATARKAPAKKATAKKAPAKKAPAKKATAEKSAARKSPAKKAAATGSATKKTPAKKAAATRSATKKTPAKRTAAKKAPAKRSPAKRADT
ncbi:histone H1-like repetitive region-containing protein [Ilumatobacter sp.]|uniref:histone H1-like repetitive region-containing protein n=1 Tax=Ilumatobacter sp. TaxID=1967498 RepID=UPI003AF5D1EE